MIFLLFAEFYFLVAVRLKWRDSVENILKEHWLECGEKWYPGDFKYTKRASVVIDTATTELWPCINQYHEKGMLMLMDVGKIHFYDHQQTVEEPFIHTNDLNKPQYQYFTLTHVYQVVPSGTNHYQLVLVFFVVFFFLFLTSLISD